MESTKSSVDHRTDEEIVARAQAGDSKCEEFLIDKFKGLVKIKARVFFIPGADHDDLIQEGMIGLFKAIRDYDGTRGTRFSSFAELCVTRQIITAIRSAARYKHAPLNAYESLDQPLNEAPALGTLLDVLTASGVQNPEQLLLSKERLVAILTVLGEEPTDLEFGAIIGYADGLTYAEIAHDLGSHVKAIDNALQRVKKKFQDESKCLPFRHAHVAQ